MKILRVLPVLFCLAAPLSAQGGYLGVALGAPETDLGQGALVQEVLPRSAALYLGLEVGDLVLTFDEEAVQSPQHLAALVAHRLPGEVVDLTVLREGVEYELAGLLGRRPTQRGSFAPSLPPGGFAVDPFAGMPPVNLAEVEWVIPPLELFESPWMPPAMELPQIDWVVPHLQLEPFSFPQGEGESSVSIRYPESTPEAERQRLLDEAVQKYGEGVDVRFEGDATIIQIHRSLKGAPSPLIQPRGEPESEPEVF